MSKNITKFPLSMLLPSPQVFHQHFYKYTCMLFFQAHLEYSRLVSEYTNNNVTPIEKRFKQTKHKNITLVITTDV